MRSAVKFHYVLIILAAEIVLITSVRDQMSLTFVGLSFILLLSFAAFWATRRRSDQIIALSLGLIAFTLNGTSYLFDFPVVVEVLSGVLWINFTAYLAYLIMRYIFGSESVGPQEIYGAVSVYLLIGIAFAQVNEILFYLDRRAIYFDPVKFGPQPGGTGDVIYYSFATLTTGGFGDVTPGTPAARAVSMIESVTGVMYIAILIARFVALHLAASQARRR